MIKAWRNLLLALVVLTVTGCAVCDPNRYTKTGLIIGVVSGGLAGMVAGGGLLAVEGAAGAYVGRRLDNKRAAEGPCVEPKEEEVIEVEEEEINLDELSVDDLTSSLLADLEGSDETELALEDESSLEAEVALADEQPAIKALDLNRVYNIETLDDDSNLTADAEDLLNSVIETLKQNENARAHLSSTVPSLEVMSTYLKTKGITRAKIVLKPSGRSTIADIEIKVDN